MRFRHYHLAALGYIAILLFVFGLAPFFSPGKMLFGDDLHLTYYFFRSFFRNALLSGEFPWWNPYLFGGYPYAAHPQTLQMFYPVHWLFAVIPVAPMFTWYIAGHVFLAMLGVYWLAGFYVRKPAAFISGLVFGLSGFFMARIWAGHVDMIAAAAYLPWVFGFFWKAMEKGKARDIVIAGIVLTVQLFVGYQTMALYTIEAIGIAALIISAKQKSFRPLARMAISVFLGIGMSAVQLIPQEEFLSRSIRTFPFPYDWASGQHLIKEQLKTLINPFLYGNQRVYTGPWPNLAEYAMYVGLVPLGLAAATLPIAIFSVIIPDLSRNRRIVHADSHDNYNVHNQKVLLVLVFALIAVFALWVSFADKAPFDLLYLLWKYIPVYQSLRIPTRHLILFVFGLSLLSGFTLHWFKNKIIITILAVLILIDLIPFARNFIELRDIPEKRHDTQLISYLKNDSSLYRTHPIFGVWLEPRSSFDFDSAMTYKIFSTNGYDPSILRNYYEFIDAAGGHSTPSFLDTNVQVPYMNLNSPYINFLNIKYIFMPNWLDPIAGMSTPQYRLIFDNPQRQYRLYENKDVSPRFYLVPEATSYSSKSQLYADFVGGKPDLLSSVMTTEKIKNIPTRVCHGAVNGQVDVISYSLNAVKLRINSPCDSYLVSSEVMYPGWEATIDGKRTQVFEGNMAFRTMFVPQGSHEIVYWYNPRIFLIGGGVSVLFSMVGLLLYRKNWNL